MPRLSALSPPRLLLALLPVLALLALLAMARPIDHDESQYVAAAALAWHGLPYRDFAYLQTPLQPFLFAPFAAMAGPLGYLALRLLNAALGTVTLGFVHAGARAAGAGPASALAAAALLGCCDIFLFSMGVARNDALPAALFAAAIWLILRAVSGKDDAAGALLIGLLLAAAGAAKLSYAIPALCYGGYALVDRRHRPVALVAGALPVLLLTGWLYALAPDAFIFQVIRFPVAGPAEWYGTGQRALKLSLGYRLTDTVKFLALGPALLAIGIVLRGFRPGKVSGPLAALALGAMLAAVLPAPTWRQYLLPVLPPLFGLLALALDAAPPGRGMRIAMIVFACAGLAPSVEALIGAGRTGLPMIVAMREGAAIADALDRASVTGPIATLSPQFVPATGRPIDPRFAAGPFLFRGHGLLTARSAAAMHVVTRDSAVSVLPPPAALLTGGEAKWTSGDAATDAALKRYPPFDGWRRVPLASKRFRLYLPPAAAAATRP